ALTTTCSLSTRVILGNEPMGGTVMPVLGGTCRSDANRTRGPIVTDATRTAPADPSAHAECDVVSTALTVILGISPPRASSRLATAARADAPPGAVTTAASATPSTTCGPGRPSSDRLVVVAPSLATRPVSDRRSPARTGPTDVSTTARPPAMGPAGTVTATWPAVDEARSWSRFRPAPSPGDGRWC